MITLLILILIMIGFFKVTGVLFRIAGKILGGILSLFGWLILAGFAVTLFGLAVYAFPVVLAVGIIALILAAVT